MVLATNSKLGPYQIKSPLGAGGMGEVYRARDARLNRDVAIKVLRTDGTAAADLRSRFEREARAVATLNHPNIVAVFDFGIEQDQQYIVSELIEGESLRAVLRGKVVASRKLVDIATQIADGLAAAHAAGIVHRDLKPENIMIGKDGRVKILDFGLARQARTSGIFTAGSQDETISGLPANRNITGEGAVIGTPNYMSPEQALGQELGYHSDQFSFGLILYELASGKQAFVKANTIETMAAIVREEPAPMDEKLPPPLRWIIDRCLAKEPEQRYESTLDLSRDLKNLRDHFSEAYSSGAFPQVAAASAKTSYKRLAAICLTLIVITSLLVYALKPSGQNVGDLRYTPFASNAEGGCWSPDGKSVAYAAYVDGVEQTFLKILTSPIHQQLTYSKIDTVPLGWSADGSHIVVVSPTQGWTERFYYLSTAGGEPEFILEAEIFTSALSRDGKALAILRKRKDNLISIAISNPIGSPFVDYEPAPFATPTTYDHPQLDFAPDGKSLLLIEAGANNQQAAWLLPFHAGGKAPTRVLPAISSLKRYPTFGWMPDSSHLVLSLTMLPDSPSHLWLADIRSGKLMPLTRGLGSESFPVPSPDGQSLLFTNYRSSLDVVSLSLADGSLKTIISTGHNENMASWAAKQEKKVWVTDRSGATEIWLHSSDGNDRPIVTAEEFPGERLMNPSLSPTGDRMIFAKSDRSGAIRLWITSISGGRPIRLTNVDTGSEWGGSWSSDGNRFVYRESRREEELLEMVKTNGSATPVVINNDCLGIPQWSPDGDWITCLGDSSWRLTSPDGKTSKQLGQFSAEALAFSKDGKSLYGILNREPKTGKEGAFLTSIDVDTLKQNVIKDLGVEFLPATNISPGIRLSMSPDGKTFLYSIAKRNQDVWMLQGFKQPSWTDRFSRY